MCCVDPLSPPREADIQRGVAQCLEFRQFETFPAVANEETWFEGHGQSPTLPRNARRAFVKETLRPSKYLTALEPDLLW
jgi:hypothetical protein